MLTNVRPGQAARDRGEPVGSPELAGSALRNAVAMLTRPFPLRPRVVVPAIVLMVLVPGCLVIPAAALIALSTSFTKQHYVADVVAGMFLAGIAYFLFLHRCPRVAVPEPDRRAAPLLMLGLFGIYALIVTGLWVAYRLR